MIKSSADIIEAARKLSQDGKRRRVAVAAAEDADVLGAVRSAYDDGICAASLYGDEKKIRDLAAKQNLSLDHLDIINQPDPHQSVMQAVELAANGQADVIMKGFVSTSDLLKGVLDKRFNLRASPTMSHVAVLDVPSHDRLLMITDGGMVVKPTVDQKYDMLKNAVMVGRALGISPVKVALSSAADHVSSAMPQSLDCAQVMKRAAEDRLENCEVAGPMGFDVAFSPDVAAHVGIQNSVAGQADVYLTGSIEEGNITAKSMIIFANAVFAGVIVGAKVPVSLVSRTDPVLGKKTSIALACLIADLYRREGKEQR
jgi:phosphate butyryltransferase